MDRRFYLDLAKAGMRFPIGTDLVLHEQADPKAVVRDGARLGKVFQEAAERYHSPLAIPVMDLTLEKSALLAMLDVPAEQWDTWHFAACPTDEQMATVQRRLSDPLDAGLRANCDAIRYIATKTKLIPAGMCIGPFSMMTKLLADPITPLYIAGSGVSAAEDPEVAMVERALELSIQLILRSIKAQVLAGAKVVVVAEPAANKAYISPNQMEAGSDIFDRYVMKYNQQIVDLLKEMGADLFFHCCGELTDTMVQKFNELRPVMMSLGASRKLWQDANLVDKDVVLFGNLPTKKFYSDDLVSVEGVKQMTLELLERMEETGHPFILGSECDVLSVKGHEKTIKDKVMAMLEVPAPRRILPNTKMTVGFGQPDWAR